MKPASNIRSADKHGNIDPSLFEHMVVLRRWFHRHPELAFKEADTAARIVSELKQLGIASDYAGMGHAVIATIDGRDATRPMLALRAEMDACPVMKRRAQHTRLSMTAECMPAVTARIWPCCWALPNC